MFFICGINQEQKELCTPGPFVCDACGSYGRYRVYMTYMCLSLFFIPVLKWSRHYYVETTCCHSVYELNADTGNRIRRGGEVEIRREDLTLIRRGAGNFHGGSYQNPESICRCPVCGYETAEDFAFCPKCGARLEREDKNDNQ